MDWKEKMKQAMIDIQDACKENQYWTDCCECPFSDFCDAIYVNIQKYPDEWENIK